MTDKLDNTQKPEITDEPKVRLDTGVSKPHLIMEGVVNIKKLPFPIPDNCNKNCKQYLPLQLVGTLDREHGSTNVGYFDYLLESLQGKYIKVYIEVE